MPADYAVIMCDVNICMFLFNAKAQRREDDKVNVGPQINANKRELLSASNAALMLACELQARGTQIYKFHANTGAGCCLRRSNIKNICVY